MSEFLSILGIRKNQPNILPMAGKPISMASFRQAILLKLQQNMSNRKIAERLGINKETVNNKFAFIRDNGLSMEELLKLDDPELERVFHGGHAVLSG